MLSSSLVHVSGSPSPGDSDGSAGLAASVGAGGAYALPASLTPSRRSGRRGGLTLVLCPA